MLLNKPLPNFLTTLLFIAATTASTSAFATDHGAAAEASAAKETIEHAASDSKAMLKDGDVDANSAAKTLEGTELDAKSEEMINKLENETDSVSTE